MKGLHGIIFSYEKHDDLRELTLNRTPASVPFAGRYRIWLVYTSPSPRD